MNSQCKKHLQKALKNNPLCCVLITCEGPSENGEMEVKMTHHGDATLVSFLLQGAQSVIDAEEEEQSSEEESEEEDQSIDSIYLVK